MSLHQLYYFKPMMQICRKLQTKRLRVVKEMSFSFFSLKFHYSLMFFTYLAL